MRQKRPYMIFTFQTTTAAMAMEKSCAKQGIPGRLIPVPGEISAGCGLAWRMKVEDYKEKQEELEGLKRHFWQIREIIL